MSASFMLALSTQRTIGLVMMSLVMLAAVAYLIANIFSARDELGSEVELAANREEYFPDEILEGKKLDRSLTMGLATLSLVGLTLPMYWLAEPGRQAGAVKEYNRIFASRGEGLYEANCSSCHGPGAVGGVAEKILLTPAGEYIDTVAWTAPALNNILLRYDRSEVEFVLNHGRRFSPMQPWSTVGGGAMTSQQISNIIDYLDSVQLTPRQAQEEILDGLAEAKSEAAKNGVSYDMGEALFNLQAANKSYSCARCHTSGFSYEQAETPGGGWFGPSLIGAGERFASPEQYAAFIAAGCEEGATYGLGGQCDGGGQMPGFGDIYTAEQIDAVVAYESSLTEEASE